MSDIFNEVRDGTVGHFWMDLAYVKDLKSADSGYVRLHDDGHFWIELLATHRASSNWPVANDAPPDSVETLYAATHAAGCVFFDAIEAENARIMGATRASITKYRSGGLLAGLYLRDVASDKFTEMQVTFPGVLFWSGIGGVKGISEKDEEARAVSYSVSLRSAQPRETPERRGVTVSLASRWSVSGPEDNKLLSNPLTVTTRSRKPRSWIDHVTPILAIQNLISLGFQGFVAADVGTARIETFSAERPLSSPDLYVSELMHVPRATKPPKSLNEFPTFNLSDINGIRGVDAWVRLEQNHPRAAGPLAKIYRFGDSQAIETRLIEVAVAIDYWIHVHRRTTKWAQVKKGDNPYSLALHVGPAFGEFVGDITKWSKIFRGAYNDLKHNPRFKYGIAEIGAVAQSGEILLQCALMNQVAGNKQITRKICESHRTHYLGRQIREIVKRGHL